MPHSPEWHLDFKEYLDRMKLTLGSFQDMLQLPNVERVQEVMPLKEMKEAHSIMPMPKGMLNFILRNIPTMDGQMPFKNATFEMQKVGVRPLRIGQKFAYRENYTGLLENLSDIFGKTHAINSSVFDLGAYIVVGVDAEEKKILALYLPPIFEAHNGILVIMDGIHRDYIALKMGVTMFAIVATGVSVPFPCSPHPWDDLKVISMTEKPGEQSERYWELQKQLFRNLKHLGIDG